MKRHIKLSYAICVILSAIVVAFNLDPITISSIVLLNILCLIHTKRCLSLERTLEDTYDERYNAFVESNSEGIWRFELKKPCPTTLSTGKQVEWIFEHGYFAECNNIMARMCGFYSPEDIIGKPLTLSLSKNVLNPVFVASFIKKDYKLANIESIETNAYGEKRYFSVSLFGSVENGKLLRGCGKQRDISNLKKYNEERETLLNEAREAKIIAELANKEKDRILANLSHELKTPLISIVGYSDMLSEDTPKEELIKGLQIINRNGKIQLDMIEELLSISSTTSGKVIVTKEDFDLKELLSYRIESLKHKYESKNLKVILKGSNFQVHADQTKVGQIFNNLLSNAIKFTDKGTITVTYGHDKDNSFFFAVEDTGIGIPEKNFKDLFEQYYQIDGGSSKARSGVGLGLFIVKKFVNLHKGRVELESKLGVGSKFIVKLPLNGNDLRVLDKGLEGLHVLLVEDDENIGTITKLLLERSGMLVNWEKNATEARNAVRNYDFDLFVFDVAMPNEDGISLIKSLRVSGVKTPSIAVSAYREYENIALSSGFDMFVTKPLTLDKLESFKSLL